MHGGVLHANAPSDKANFVFGDEGQLHLKAGGAAGSSGPSHSTFGLSTVEGLHKTLTACGRDLTPIVAQDWIAGVNEVLGQIRRKGNPNRAPFHRLSDARWKCDLEDRLACGGFCGAWPARTAGHDESETKRCCKSYGNLHDPSMLSRRATHGGCAG